MLTLLDNSARRTETSQLIGSRRVFPPELVVMEEEVDNGMQSHVLVQKQLQDVILTQQAAYDKLKQSVSILLARWDVCARF